MPSESFLLKQIQLVVAKTGARLLRNNVGTGWTGQMIRPTTFTTVRVGPGDLVIRNARPLHAGLCVGSSDLIGWTPCVISGQAIAKFTAVEVKTGKLRLTSDQQNFIDAVKASGGIGICARSVDDALRGIHAGQVQE